MAFSSANANGHISMSLASSKRDWRVVKFSHGELMGLKFKNFASKRSHNKAVKHNVCMSIAADFASDAKVSDSFLSILSPHLIFFCHLLVFKLYL